MAELTRWQILDLLNRPGPLWLVGFDLSGLNLARADLSGADLEGANLTGASLVRASGILSSTKTPSFSQKSSKSFSDKK